GPPMGMNDFQFLLRDLATAFREDALWQGQVVPGRFYINPLEVPTGDIEPGISTTETRVYCDPAVTPKPWPTLGAHLVIPGQAYEIVSAEEAAMGELAFRLIKSELGIRTVTSEGIYSTGPEPTPYVGPGRPTRRVEIVTAYNNAIAAGLISADQPIHEVVAA